VDAVKVKKQLTAKNVTSQPMVLMVKLQNLSSGCVGAKGKDKTNNPLKRISNGKKNLLGRGNPTNWLNEDSGET